MATLANNTRTIQPKRYPAEGTKDIDLIGAGTMSATTRVPSTYSWRTSASTPNLTHTTTGNNRFRHI